MIDPFIPRVKFQIIDLNREVELFYSFIKSNFWPEVFDRNYPELRLILKESKSKTDCINKYKDYFEKLHLTKSVELTLALEKIIAEWGKFGSDFLKILSEHFQTNWPMDKAEIVGYVSLLPVFPRFIDDYSFCLGHKDINRMIETSAHEIVHFLWFKKWQEVFPETKRQDYERPHLVWRLSEIMDPIILQCQPEIKELIKPKGWGYSNFATTMIGEVSITEYFKKIYLDYLASDKKDFSIFLKNIWIEAQKHEEEIGKF
jgi:hypothetical protein